ncbi:MAG: Type 1 glutamine amidotransferase-like domain-containing protein [Chloroflexota bacterium]
MTGPVALHGGGEFRAGDEPFLAALLELAAARVEQGADGRPIRIAIVPTAAARGRPDLSAAEGVAAFERVAADGSFDVDVRSVAVVDRATATDRGLVERLAEADVIHFPGGDPDLIPMIMHGSPAWAAVTNALAAGAILAGASAGAMAFGSWTWTPGGGIAGLMIVHGIVVVPHVKPATWETTIERFRAWAPPGLGALGLAEQTGAIRQPVIPGGATIGWRVVGLGEARWLPALGDETVVGRSGDVIEIPVIPL